MKSRYWKKLVLLEIQTMHAIFFLNLTVNWKILYEQLIKFPSAWACKAEVNSINLRDVDDANPRNESSAELWSRIFSPFSWQIWLNLSTCSCFITWWKSTDWIFPLLWRYVSLLHVQKTSTQKLFLQWILQWMLWYFLYSLSKIVISMWLCNCLFCL